MSVFHGLFYFNNVKRLTDAEFWAENEKVFNPTMQREMTARDLGLEGGLGTCEVCGHFAAVGVVSTIVPYSAGFCRGCLEKGTQPLWVLAYVAADAQAGDDLDPEFYAIVDRTLERIGLTRDDFRAEVRKSRQLLEDAHRALGEPPIIKVD